MICLYMWIEWLIVVENRIHMSKILCMNMLCFCEEWWIMKLWFDELEMNSWLIVVDDVWKTCGWWISMMIMPIGD